MEVALVIGAFVAILILVALCTFWFFNLHRSYLVLAAKEICQNPAEDDDSSNRLFLMVDDSEEDRGEKFLFVGGSPDVQISPQFDEGGDGEKPRIPPSDRTREQAQGEMAVLALAHIKKK
jgi:hypothetical protein